MNDDGVRRADFEDGVSTMDPLNIKRCRMWIICFMRMAYTVGQPDLFK
jgi:hypothetical protein